MSLSKYVRTLLPTFAKSELEKHLANLQRELRENTMPPLTATNDILKNHQFKDKWLLAFDTAISRKLNPRYRGNFVNKIHAVMEKTADNLALLDRLLAKHKGRDIVISSITYNRLQILQLMDAIAFSLKYTRTLLVYTLAVETDMLRQNKTVNFRMSKAEINMLKDRRDVYFDALRAMDHTSRDMEKTISQVPEIEIDPENIDVDVAASGIMSLDPFGLAAQGLILNPIYHARIMWADWEDHRRQAAYEERVMLQYQILDIKNALEDKEDANVRKALDYSEKRLANLNYKIAKMEEV